MPVGDNSNQEADSPHPLLPFIWQSGSMDHDARRMEALIGWDDSKKYLREKEIGKGDAKAKKAGKDKVKRGFDLSDY
ncbi:hypothetical protein SUGI_0084020 [Cryptomeria japonica]|nr:hypothetical protein SUGI_0084020 [Cryptomeria japonica]